VSHRHLTQQAPSHLTIQPGVSSTATTTELLHNKVGESVHNMVAWRVNPPPRSWGAEQDPPNPRHMLQHHSAPHTAPSSTRLAAEACHAWWMQVLHLLARLTLLALLPPAYQGAVQVGSLVQQLLVCGRPHTSLWRALSLHRHWAATSQGSTARVLFGHTSDVPEKGRSGIASTSSCSNLAERIERKVWNKCDICYSLSTQTGPGCNGCQLSLVSSHTMPCCLV